MGSSHRIAAVAAVSHAKHYYNHTAPDVVQTVESTHYTVNIFFVSATLCGVLVAVCAACCRRSSAPDKPPDGADCGVYTVSADTRLRQVARVLVYNLRLQKNINGLLFNLVVVAGLKRYKTVYYGSHYNIPIYVVETSISINVEWYIRTPPHEDTAGPPPAYDSVIEDITQKDCNMLQEVVIGPCAKCKVTPRPDSGLPSYEAAVMLRDTKL